MLDRRIWWILLGLTLVFGAGSAFAANTLDVNAGAALAGNFGLEILIDGSSDNAYVEDLTPDGEVVYRAEFKSNPNSISMADGGFHMIFMGRGNGGVNMIRIAMVRKAGDYKIICRIKKDGPGTGFCGKFTMGPNNTRVGLEWVTSTGPGATTRTSGRASSRRFRVMPSSLEYSLSVGTCPASCRSSCRRSAMTTWAPSRARSTLASTRTDSNGWPSTEWFPLSMSSGMRVGGPHSTT